MYLMHRVSHHGRASKRLIEKDGLLPIGWAFLVERGYADDVIENNLTLSKTEFANYFEEFGKRINVKHMTSRRGRYLYNFLKLDKGSIVVIPFPGELTICKVKDKPMKYKNADSSDEDVGFVVPIEIIEKGISRGEYVGLRLSSKFKYRGTNLVLNDKDKEMIDSIIKNHTEENKIYDFEKTNKKIISNVNHYIKTLKPYHLEKLIQAYLKNMGADKVVIPGKSNKSSQNDKNADIDVKASFPNLGFSIYVQAKSHVGITDNTGLQQLINYDVEEDEEFKFLQPIKWLVTTGEIDADNLPEEAQEGQIKIIQDNEFAEMLVESGFKFTNDIFE